MIPPTNQNLTRTGLLLEVALQTQGCIRGFQHLVVHTSVRTVANRAAILSGLMTENIVISLSLMTAHTGITGRCQCHSSTRRRIAMWIMAICAAHVSTVHVVPIGQMKGPPRLKVTLKTRFCRIHRIHNRVGHAPAFGMQASRSVTSFTPQMHRFVAMCNQCAVSGPLKPLHQILMTHGTLLHANKLSTCNPGWNQHRMRNGNA